MAQRSGRPCLLKKKGILKMWQRQTGLAREMKTYAHPKGEANRSLRVPMHSGGLFFLFCSKYLPETKENTQTIHCAKKQGDMEEPHCRCQAAS
jgi:hypothetical protein